MLDRFKDVDALTAARLIQRGGIPPRKATALIDDFEMFEGLGFMVQLKKQRKHWLAYVEAVLHYESKVEGTLRKISINISQTDREALAPLEPQ